MSKETKTSYGTTALTGWLLWFGGFGMIWGWTGVGIVLGATGLLLFLGALLSLGEKRREDRTKRGTEFLKQVLRSQQLAEEFDAAMKRVEESTLDSKLQKAQLDALKRNLQ